MRLLKSGVLRAIRPPSFLSSTRFLLKDSLFSVGSAALGGAGSSSEPCEGDDVLGDDEDDDEVGGDDDDDELRGGDDDDDNI